MVALSSITVLTTAYNQLIRITDEVEKAVKESGVKNGMVHVITKHTTTGITVK